MAQSFISAGGNAEILHISDLIENPSKLNDFQILAFPGGFAYADDLGAGIALANRLKNNLWDDLQKFVSRDTMTIGICNGFQMMVNLGILPGLPGAMWERKVALRHNKIGEYQCLWTNVKNQSSKCLWTEGIDIMPLSVGHGEGNFYTDSETLSALKENDQVVFRYCSDDGQLANGKYPINPNGALEDIAGICDDTGRIFGLMPHPDRFLTAYNEDQWPLKKELAKRAGKEFREESAALEIYKNAVKRF